MIGRGPRSIPPSRITPESASNRSKGGPTEGPCFHEPANDGGQPPRARFLFVPEGARAVGWADGISSGRTPAGRFISVQAGLGVPARAMGPAPQAAEGGRSEVKADRRAQRRKACGAWGTTTGTRTNETNDPRLRLALSSAPSAGPPPSSARDKVELSRRERGGRAVGLSDVVCMIVYLSKNGTRLPMSAPSMPPNSPTSKGTSHRRSSAWAIARACMSRAVLTKASI